MPLAPTANNILLGFPNLADVSAAGVFTPLYSGGSWLAGLPLTNLQNRDLSKVARSTNAALTSTTFDLDLAFPNITVRLYALPKHTVSVLGTIRNRLFATLPIVDWLTVGDGAWTAVGTPTRAAASILASDGVPMDLIGDDDAGVLEYYVRNIAFTANAAKVVSVRVKQGSSGFSTVRIQDTTAVATRFQTIITWTAGVPAFNTGTGTLLSSTLIGNGVYRLVCLTTAVTAANTNRIECMPAGTVTGTAVAGTGTTYFGDVMAWNAVTDQLAYDTGAEAAYPQMYAQDSLPDGHPSQGTLTYSQDEAVGINIGYVHVSAVYHAGQYIRVTIADTTNPAGYVDLGRYFVALGYQPTCNPDYGLQYGFITATERQETDGGRYLFNVKARRRQQSFVISYLPTDEAMANVFDLQRRAGLAEQIMFVFDPTESIHKLRRSFLATMKDISPLTQALYGHLGIPISLVEEL